MLGKVCGKGLFWGLCCHFAYGYKLSSLETDHLCVKITFMEEKNKFTSSFFYLFSFLEKMCFFNPAEFNAKSSTFGYHRTPFNIHIISQSCGVGGLVSTTVVSFHSAGCAAYKGYIPGTA